MDTKNKLNRYQKDKEGFDKSHKKYMSDKSEIKVIMKKEDADKVRKYCKDKNISVNKFVSGLIHDAIK